MSTSNVKSPVIVRQGFTKDWVENSKQLEIYNVVSRELEILNLSISSYHQREDGVSITYYRWIQRLFITKKKKKEKLALKQNLRLLEKQRRRIKNVRLSNSNNRRWKLKRRYSSLRWKDKKLKRVNRRIPFLTRWYEKSKTYRLPVSIQNRVASQIHSLNVSYLVEYSNLWSKVSGVNVDLIDFYKKNPQLNFVVRMVHYVSDYVVVADFISRNMCNINLLGNLIGKIIERSSKKGALSRALKTIAKVPTFIQSYLTKHSREFVSEIENRDWSWVVKITGKLNPTGRTKNFWIRPLRFPLHTLDINYSYFITHVNTKAGVYSVKIWKIAT